MLSIVCNQCTYYVYFKHLIFCPGQGNRFPKMLDLYIKVLLKCNGSGCYSMVVQLFELSTDKNVLTGYIYIYICIPAM